MTRGQVALVFLGALPTAFAVLAYFVTRSANIFYARRFPAVVLLAWLVVFGFGCFDLFRLYGTGRPTDFPRYYVIRVCRAYAFVPLIVMAAYVASYLLELEAPWPAPVAGVAAFCRVRMKYIRSPIKDEQPYE
jgi:hypothetical protein